MQYKTQGIIIKRRNFGEADRLLTIYTEKKGKVTAIAKSVRKIKSKLAGHLELFYLSDFMIVEGKNIDTITGAVNIENYCHLRNSLRRSNQAYYMAEIIDKLCGENEVNKPIFNLLKSTMKKIGDNKLLLSYFSIRALKFLGHKPEINICTYCHKKLSSNNQNYFSNSFGGIICQKCKKEDLNCEKINVDTIKLLRLLLENDIYIIDKLNNKYSVFLDNLVLNFLEFILEKEIKSKKFL